MTLDFGLWTVIIGLFPCWVLHMIDSVRGVICWLVGCVVGLLVVSRYPSGLTPAYGIICVGAALLMLVPIGLGWKHAPVWGPALLAALALAGCGRALVVHAPETAASLAYYRSATNGPKVT